MKKIPHGSIPATVDQLLEREDYFLPTLRPMERYARLHDEHDGTNLGQLIVTMGPDADMYVCTQGEGMGATLRFRNYMGGGRSIMVRNALAILARAIQLENDSNPV